MYLLQQHCMIFEKPWEFPVLKNMLQIVWFPKRFEYKMKASTTTG